jgi:cytosine deaminase
MILSNVRPWGADSVDIVVAGSRIGRMVPAGTAAAAGERIDGGGRLALPGFVNAHAHVDKSWWGRPWVSYAGEATTQGRIAPERAERDALGIPSVASTTAVLREFLRHGTTATRTHVDVDLGVGLRGIETVRAAAAALDGAIDVEIVAFPQDGVIRRHGVLELLDRAASAGVASIGGIDPASIDRDPVAQLDGLFAIAERRGVGLDIHLHDGGELGGFQYELIIDRTSASAPTASATCGPRTATGTCCGSRSGSPGCTACAPTTSSPARSSWPPAARPGSFVHRPRHDLVPGARADVVLLDAENVPDALVRAPARRLVVAGGRLVVADGELPD